MHSRQNIEYWKERIPNLAKAMLIENIEEAEAVIKQWPLCDDFVLEHWQFVGTDGGDNTLDIVGYWNDCYDILKTHKPECINVSA